MKCSICGKPNETKKTCSHCWAGKRCNKFKCDECKKLGQNYGTIIKTGTCSECNFTYTVYENGQCHEFGGYESDYSTEDAYDDAQLKHTNCTECRTGR